MILEFMSRSFPFVSLMFGRIKMLMPKISNEIIKKNIDKFNLVNSMMQVYSLLCKGNVLVEIAPQQSAMNTESIFNCSYKNAQRRTRLRFKNVLVSYSRKLDRQIKSELTKTIVKSIIFIEYVTMRALETQAYIKFLYLMWEFRNVIPSPTRIFGKVSLKNNIYDI